MTQTEQYMINLELLKMAKEALCEEYYGKREVILREYESKLANDIWNVKAPELPAYPTTEEITEKAKALANFVFNH